MSSKIRNTLAAVHQLEADAVRRLVARAGAPPSGSVDRSLIAADVLVIHGSWRKNLAIYDGFGGAIGSATRVKGGYRARDARYHYLLSDTTLRCVVCEDTARRMRILPGRPTFTVLDADDLAIGVISRGEGFQEYSMTADGLARGALRRVRWRKASADRPPFAFADVGRRWQLIDRLASHVWYVLAEPERLLARITHLFDGRSTVTYVLERERSLAEPMRTLALGLVIVIDNRITDPRGD